MVSDFICQSLLLLHAASLAHITACMYCGIIGWREKAPFATTSFKKVGWACFQGRAYIHFSEVKPGCDWIDMYPITPLCHTCNTHTLVLQQMKAQGSPTICGARGCVEEQLLVQM